MHKLPGGLIPERQEYSAEREYLRLVTKYVIISKDSIAWGTYMYSLLLVTDKASIRDLYANYPDWEQQGFVPPVITESAEDGIAALCHGKFDAISWLLPVGEAGRLNEKARLLDMYGMETAHSAERLKKSLGDARRELISQEIHLQKPEPDDVLNTMRDDFLRDLLRGAITDREVFFEREAALHLEETGAAKPVAVTSFRIPEGDRFYEDRWKYGKKRLEFAIRNAFGQSDRELFCICALNPHHMRAILISDADHTEQDSFLKIVRRLGRARCLLEKGFDLSLQTRWVRAYPNLYAFAEENLSKAAH